MIKSLRGAVEVEHGLCLACGLGSGREAYASEAGVHGGECLGVDHPLHGVGVYAFVVGHEGAVRHSFGSDVAYAFHGAVGLAGYDERGRVDEFEERLSGSAAFDIRSYRHLVEL